MIKSYSDTDPRLANPLYKQKIKQEATYHNHQQLPQTKIISSVFQKDQKPMSKFYVCFNPSCSFPSSRVFKSDHSHHVKNSCLNWTLSENQFHDYLESGQFLRGNFSQNQLKNFLLSIGDKPMIQNIEILNYLKVTDWNKYYDNFFLSLKEKIEKQFNEIVVKLKQKIQSFKTEDTITNIEDLFENIRNHKKNDVQNRKQIQYIINEFILPLENRTITIKQPKIQDFSIFSNLHDAQQQKQFFNDENKERAQLSSPRLRQKQRQNVRNQQEYPIKDEIIEFLTNSPSPFNKVQQVASFCGRKCQYFIFKANAISLKCPFCQFKYADQYKDVKNMNKDQLKIAKKQIGMEVVDHLIKDHYQMIQIRYKTKYLKNSSTQLQNQKPRNNSNQTNRNTNNGFEITFDQFISELREKNYKNLHIIDRQTGYTQTPNISDQCYVIEIISRSNKAQARQKYIMTSDRKCTEFIINYIAVYACWIGNYIQSKNVYFYSNSRDINRYSSIVEVLERKQIQRSLKMEKKNTTKRSNFCMERKKIENNDDYQQRGNELPFDNMRIPDRLLFEQQKDDRYYMNNNEKIDINESKIKLENDL